jgi:hypothetical protein
VSWTGRPNPVGAQPAPATSAAAMNLGLLGVAALMLPAAAALGRRRRRRSPRYLARRDGSEHILA